MALQTKTFSSTTTSNGFTLKLTVIENNILSADNKSQLDYVLTLHSTGYNFSQYRIGWSISLGGTVVSSQSRTNAPQKDIGKNSSIPIASGSYDAVHDSDGKKTIAIAASIDMSKVSYTPGAMSLSGSMPLTTIARTSELSFGTFTIGSSSDINIKKQNSVFTDTITYTFGTLSGTIANKISNTPVNWTPPEDFYKVLPTSDSGVGKFTLTTYNGNSVVGTKTYNFTALVGKDIVPKLVDVSVSPINDNEWINNNYPNQYIANFSRAKFDIEASASKGSSIAYYQITGDLGSYQIAGNNEISWTSPLITSFGYLSYSVAVVDSRGRSNSIGVGGTTIKALDYFSPRISNLKYERGEYKGDVWRSSDDGGNLKVDFDLNMAPLQNNVATIEIELSDEDIEPINVDGVSIGHQVFYIENVGVDNTYSLSVVATDCLSSGIPQTITVATIEVPLNINFDIPAIAFGGIATKPKTVQSYWPGEFKSLTLNEPLSIESGGLGATSVVSAKEKLALCCRATGVGESVLPDTALVAGEIKQVNLSEFSVNTSDSVFVFTENGGVKCNEAGTVLISGSTYIGRNIEDVVRMGCYIYQNDIEITSQFICNISIGTVSGGVTIVSVNAGDVIYLKARCSAEARFYPRLCSLSIAYV